MRPNSMQLDPRTIFTVLSVFGLACSGLLTAVTWRKRAYPGYTQWICAAVLSPVAAFLVTLRPTIPEWVSVLVANAVIIAASILYFDGARAFRGQNPHRMPVYAGCTVTISALAFFLYVVPSVNVRVVIVSTLTAIIFLWA